jgi:hypothetical protein
VNHAESKADTIFFAMKPRFTEREGQYLAFIYYYTKLNGRPPAEADMQRFFSSYPAFSAPDGRYAGDQRLH